MKLHNRGSLVYMFFSVQVVFDQNICNILFASYRNQQGDFCL
uniref:Uncharacterized protein n=1 Tax=Arundo donax TaxID=35708 RepID=A0A0A9HF00_ARUDO